MRRASRILLQEWSVYYSATAVAVMPATRHIDCLEQPLSTSLHPLTAQHCNRSAQGQAKAGNGSTAWATCLQQRGFAASRAPAHSGCGHSHHHGHEDCAADGTAEIVGAKTLEQLQQVLQESGGANALTAAQAAAAFRQAATLAAGEAPGAAATAVHELSAQWPALLPAAQPKDLSSCLLAWTKLGLQDEQLWSTTVAAIPALAKAAGGQDLSNYAYALATVAAQRGGSLPGVSREQVQDVLRLVTEEVVSLVSGAPAGDGCGSSGRQVSVGNLATLRWAHELFEQCCKET